MNRILHAGAWAPTIALLLLSSRLDAQSTTTWQGSDGVWGTASNWSHGTPAVGFSPVFDGQGASSITGGSPTYIAGASFTGGSYTLTFSGNGKMNTHTISVAAGTQTFNGSRLTSSTMTLAVSSGATLNVSNQVSGALILASEGETTISGVISGGGGNAVTKTHAGTATLSGANIYSGNTIVSGGTLLYNGSLTDIGDGTVTVNSGGTLGGTGTIGQTTTINSGGTLAPGASMGVLSFGDTLTLASGSTTIFDFNGTVRGAGYDGINSAGLTNYGGTLSLNFGSTFSSGGTFDLFDLAGGVGSTSFEVVTGFGSYAGGLTKNAGRIWSGTIGGQTLSFDESTGDLTITALTAIPEPGTYAALVGFTALTAAIWLRRKDSSRRA